MKCRTFSYKKVVPKKLRLKSNTCLQLAYSVQKKQGVRVAVLVRLSLDILLHFCEKGTLV